MPIPKEPIVFLKSLGALSGPNDDVKMPRGSKKLDWEVELGIVIGKTARYVPEHEAMDHVAGYCVCNDVSEREFQLERGGTWDKGKGCDTFGPTGPWMVTKDEVPDPQNLNMWCEVDGKRMQDGTTQTMIFDCRKLVSYTSHFITLYPGDIISTGTPPGVGSGKKPTPDLPEARPDDAAIGRRTWRANTARCRRISKVDTRLPPPLRGRAGVGGVRPHHANRSLADRRNHHHPPRLRLGARPGRRRKLHGGGRTQPAARLFRSSAGVLVDAVGGGASAGQRGAAGGAPAVHPALRAVHLADVPARHAVAGEPAGLWAAVTLNLSPVFGVTTGSWVLPDGPLDCALLGGAICLVHALPARGRIAAAWWGGAGLCAGLALFSKYSAVLVTVRRGRSIC